MTFQVVVLGSSGGPIDRGTCSYLVRGSPGGEPVQQEAFIAVDAGCFLAGIINVLEKQVLLSPQEYQHELLAESIRPNQASQRSWNVAYPPFDASSLPYGGPTANAAHILSLVSTICITHPHLDHISGVIMNSAAFSPQQTKRLAGLPRVIQALKDHVFNGVIWPNLTNEGVDAVHLVQLLRLSEHLRSPDLASGLTVTPYAVSHGHILRPAHQTHPSPCHHQPFKPSFSIRPSEPSSEPHRGSRRMPSSVIPPDSVIEMRRQSLMLEKRQLRASIASVNSHLHSPTSPSLVPHRKSSGGTSSASSVGSVSPSSYPTSNPTSHPTPGPPLGASLASYDSTAFFIHDSKTNRVLLMWGDVEPDSISYTPRNYLVWRKAAEYMQQGLLAGVFIECSFANPHDDALLFGHFSPRHLIAELKYFASMVEGSEEDFHAMVGWEDLNETNEMDVENMDEEVSIPVPQRLPQHTQTHGADLHLQGLPVVITHVKEDIYNEDPENDPRKVVLEDIIGLAKIENIGCDFIVATPGLSLHL
ncbi:3',5'-cyclic-nucleotide phosphodiesterase [Yarrowia sp. B02]|nr:3',5'-cyclic-nucleotide phosphodiesterase [Yarrowia sp. B02]